MDDSIRTQSLDKDRADTPHSSWAKRAGIQAGAWPRDLEIGGFSENICSRTRETKEHVLYVAAMTVKLARMAGIPECDILSVRNGALLHDIGKIGVPEEILMKAGSLTQAEWEIMRNHPRYAYDLLFPMSFLRPYLAIPFFHHEKWDGSGYPQGLKGERIPLAARIFAIVDVWDALSSDQVFRKAWPQEKAMEFIHHQVGSHFDPFVVKLFMTVMPNTGLKGLEGKRELSPQKRINVEV